MLTVAVFVLVHHTMFTLYIVRSWQKPLCPGCSNELIMGAQSHLDLGESIILGLVKPSCKYYAYISVVMVST